MSNPLTQAVPPIHPGVYLRDTIIPALDATKQGFAEHIGIGRQTLYDLLDGRSAVTAAMALRLARATGVRAQMWMSLQALFELKTAEAELGDQLARISKLPVIAAAVGQASGKGTAVGRGAGVIQGGKAVEADDRYSRRDQTGQFKEFVVIGRPLKAKGGQAGLYRSAATGAFVAKDAAASDPAGTIRETVRTPDRKR